MNREELIESIVREVRRVLADRGIDVVSSPGETAPSRESVKPAASPGVGDSVLPSPDTAIGQRDLTGKQIITQKDLEAFAGKSIRVGKKAVITPLAIDYAREKGIRIEKVDEPASAFGGSASAPPQITAALVVSADFTGDGKVVAAILGGKGFRVKDFSSRDYESAVKKLGDAVSSGGADFGVCIENTGMEGPIHANRNPAVRAVHCRTTIDARAARVDYGANVIVIDSTSDPNAVISGFCGM